LKDCTFEIVMFDTRELTDVEQFMGKLVYEGEYWSVTPVINYLYAKQFGYNFTFVHLDKDKMLPKYNVAWHRVFYFAERLEELKQQKKENVGGASSCTWLLYLDTDAFVRGFSTSLASFVSDMASKYRMNDDVGAIFAQEQVKLPEMPTTWHAVNAGVYLVNANSESSHHLFDTWQNASEDDVELEQSWPAEQGVLTELVLHGKYYTKVNKRHAQLRNHDEISGPVAVVNMTEMNSPWGRFVEHVWSGPGAERRNTEYMDMLARINASKPDYFAQMLAEVRDHIVDWTPHAN